ncbi:MAG: branched-chain amino acid ABC transporter permease [Eubacteriales bacterium]|nr:branched-chain amino acid ABC transporter permease [Eubacteriales bacterium]
MKKNVQNIELTKNKFGIKQGGLIAIVVAVLLLPLVLSNFQTELLAKFFVFALVGVSYDLIWGFAGISNFGHAVFFGLGAYAFGIVSKYLQIPGVTYIALLAAIIVPTLLGVFLSLFLHHGKVAGAFFAVVTMCLCVVFESIASAWTDVTGGMNGLYGFATPKLGIPGLWEFEIKGFKIPYYLIVVCLGLILFLLWRIMKHRNFGKVIAALNNDENRLEFLGVKAKTLKTIIFAISCAVAGFAGALYVPVSTISPSILGMGMSIQVLVWVAVGGRGTLWGPVIGAVLVCSMEQLLSGVLLDFWLLIIGVFFIFVVMFWPKGIAGLWVKCTEFFNKKRAYRKSTAKEKRTDYVA